MITTLSTAPSLLMTASNWTVPSMWYCLAIGGYVSPDWRTNLAAASCPPMRMRSGDGGAGTGMAGLASAPSTLPETLAMLSWVADDPDRSGGGSGSTLLVTGSFAIGARLGGPCKCTEHAPRNARD